MTECPLRDTRLTLAEAEKWLHTLYPLARKVQTVCGAQWHREHPQKALSHIEKLVNDALAALDAKESKHD